MLLLILFSLRVLWRAADADERYYTGAETFTRRIVNKRNAYATLSLQHTAIRHRHHR